jgi:hypothetical protein
MLTARIEGAVSDSGVKVKSPDHLQDRVSGGTREVDVSLRSMVGSAEVLVIIECRDRGRPADVTWIEQVKSKRDAVGAAKAIAVASGTFSKKASTAAKAYGIDARTLAQVDRAEVKRWTGSLLVFQQSAHYNNARITVVLAGKEPLPVAITQNFDELVREKVFNAPFISYPGEEGVLSPLDVMRRVHRTAASFPPRQSVTVKLPPKSSFLLSNDPTMMSLIGDLPDDGSEVQRQHVLRFADGEAFFNMEGILRSLLAVHLEFTAQLESKTQIDSEAYRYVAAGGVIEVAERKMTFGAEEIFVTEHRQLSETLAAKNLETVCANKHLFFRHRTSDRKRSVF